MSRVTKMNDLKKFRTRWQRWLGQKCRKDKPYWTTLLNSEWTGWVDSVMRKKLCIPPYIMYNTREGIKHYFDIAIHNADMSDLRRLDNLYCLEKMAK